VGGVGGDRPRSGARILIPRASLILGKARVFPGLEPPEDLLPFVKPRWPLSPLRKSTVSKDVDNIGADCHRWGEPGSDELEVWTVLVFSLLYSDDVSDDPVMPLQALERFSPKSAALPLKKAAPQPNASSCRSYSSSVLRR
jgi:hypothetical protein